MYIYNSQRLFFKIFVANIILSLSFLVLTLLLDISNLVLTIGSNDFQLAYVVFVLLSLVLNFVLLKIFYFAPLLKIMKEVSALLAGAKYSRIIHKNKDEFGLLAMFFNEVTKNIEHVSQYLKEGSRMASELAIASEIQKSVLPSTLPSIPLLDVVAKTRAAEEVGGDSFDIDRKDDNFYFYIGDVTGHGAPAGLIMMMVNTLFDVYLSSVSDTKELAVKINETLKPRVNASMFMTTSFFRWNVESSELFYTGCGHENIIIYRANEGVCEVFPAGGIALAMADDISSIVEEKKINLALEDIIVLYSDGITEAVNPSGELYSLERLKSAVTKYGHLGNSLDLFEALAKEVQDFVSNTIQKDDMTLMVIRYTDKSVIEDRTENLISTKWNE